MFIDPSGNFPVLSLITVGILLFTPIGGYALNVALTTVSYVSHAVISIWDEDIRHDMNLINWNPFNSNEQATLNSNSVPFYKGVPVFRTASGG